MFLLSANDFNLCSCGTMTTDVNSRHKKILHFVNLQDECKEVHTAFMSLLWNSLLSSQYKDCLGLSIHQTVQQLFNTGHDWTKMGTGFLNQHKHQFDCSNSAKHCVEIQTSLLSECCNKAHTSASMPKQRLKTVVGDINICHLMGNSSMNYYVESIRMVAAIVFTCMVSHL